MDVSDSIQEYMKEYMNLWPFSGTIRVVNKGETIFDQSYGMACIEFEVPNRSQTRFSLASVSKQFTAFAVMQLYDKALIDIDRPVNHYLPDELKVDHRITAHHLMSHTSGLTTFHGLDNSFFGDKDKSNYNRRDFLGYFRDHPLHFEPGSRFEYCNAGYHMLAFLVETVTGGSFKDYLEENIFAPLGMNDTVYDDGMEILQNKAYGYSMNNESVVRSEYHNPAYSIGAGGVVSTCADLYKWFLNLKNRKELGENTYLRFFKENANDHCYGLFHDIKYGKSRFYHDGAYLGIGAYMQHFFDDDLCIIVLCNYDFANYSRIGNAISDLIFTGKAHLPIKPAEVVLDEELAMKYEGVYIKDRAQLKRIDNQWKFVHLGRVHKPIYPIGNHQFHSTWLDHSYTLREREDGEFEFLGFRKQV
ncbi:serine hydrolase domain-containing protein [Cohnella silvisoli]|uniref:Serine hydrolase domain-containing protein n=1 Tax=Cohnella silvisoli TaxID=2873699 RepID=A0ABV1KTS7_9BACL|nr:serine hydrolase domain-containing protein [Cohnella silvisoli]MCD9022569.1 beta-lactamase family protein [Cohnella silvisoli]